MVAAIFILKIVVGAKRLKSEIVKLLICKIVKKVEGEIADG